MKKITLLLFLMVFQTALFAGVNPWRSMGDSPLVSVDQTDPKDFTMYPNPAKSTLYVTSTKQSAMVEIYSITGKLLMKKELVFGQNIINVSTLNPGIYLAKFSYDENAQLTKKLIIN